MNKMEYNDNRRLSERLKLVAAFVPQGSRIADIGTDHAYVPIYLAEQGRIASALAMDVKEGPLKRAREHIAGYKGDCPIQARLSDGLKELKAGEADTVIIAGMGGELEISILDAGRHVWDSVKTWILSPQSDLDKVRRFLADHGFLIDREAMLKEDGKFYTVMSVSRGTMSYEKEIYYLYGKRLLEKKDPVLEEYLKKEEGRLMGILEQLSENHPAATERLAELSLVKEAQHEMQ